MKNHEKLKELNPLFINKTSEELADCIDVGFNMDEAPHDNNQCDFCIGNSNRKGNCEDLECASGIQEWLDIKYKEVDPIPEIDALFYIISKNQKND